MCKQNCYTCSYSMVEKDSKLWCSEKDELVNEDECCEKYE